MSPAFVDILVPAGADHAAVLHEIWRVVDERLAQPRRELRERLVAARREIEQRYRYRPARNPWGESIAQTMSGPHEWALRVEADRWIEADIPDDQ